MNAFDLKSTLNGNRFNIVDMVSVKQNPNHIMAPTSYFDPNRMMSFNSNSYSFHQMHASQGYGSAYGHGPSPFQTLYTANAQTMYNANAPRQQTQSQWFGYQGMYQGPANTYQQNPMHAPSRLNPEAAAFFPQAYQPSLNPYPREATTQHNPSMYPMYGNTRFPVPQSQSTLTPASQRSNTPQSQPAQGRGRGGAFSFSATMSSSSQRAIPPQSSMEEMRAELLQTLQQRGILSPEQSAYRASAPPSYNAKRDPRKR